MTPSIDGWVSHRGLVSLPTELRHRWGMEAGGEVAFIDLGEAALVVPGSGGAERQDLLCVLADRDHLGVAAIGDPDLADQ